MDEEPVRGRQRQAAADVRPVGEEEVRPDQEGQDGLAYAQVR